MRDRARLRRLGPTATIVGLALLGALALPAGAAAVDVTVDTQIQDLTAGDPDQTGRLVFDTPASSCVTPQPFPGLLTGMGEPLPRNYDSYSYTNITNGTICLTVTLNPGTGTLPCTDNVFSATYRGSVAPTTPNDSDYLADPGDNPGGGETTSYEVLVDPGETWVNVVSAVDTTDVCDDYIYTLHANRPFAKTPPTTTSTPAVGSGIGFTTGTWAGTVGFTYQWRRCDTSGANCADIPGATSGAYLVTAADVGSTLRLRVTASDGTDTSSADTAATSVVPAPPATTPPQGQGGGGKANAKKCKKKGKKSSASSAKKKKCKKKKR